MRKTFILIITASLLFILFDLINIFPKPGLLKEYEISRSIKIYSSDGTLLRNTLSKKGGRRGWVKLHEVSPDFKHLLISTEDKRFYTHPGVDVLALGRATYQFIRQGKVVSGASTLPMQLARMVRGGKRSILNKGKEILFALHLELALSKKEICEIYLNQLPFGNEIYGLSEASATYFKKHPKDLSLSESAYLLGIIRAPSYYNPYEKPKETLLHRNKVLQTYQKKHKGLKEKVIQAFQEKIVVYPLKQRFMAPHFTDFVLRNTSRKTTTMRTSLDIELNERVADIIKQQLSFLERKNVSQASALVVHNQTGQIVAYVGSNDYWDDRFQGMIDGVNQKRQPGSALKTFTYAKALELGVSPSHVLPDVKQSFLSGVGDYIPENYDRHFRGPVLLRDALANSLNVPAVNLLQEIGVPHLYEVLKELKLSQLKEKPSYYGLGLTLGNVETSLFELVRAYSIFGRSGQFCDLTFLYQENQKSCYDKKDQLILSNRSLQIVRDFLSDNHAREISFGRSSPLNFDYPVMIKTGTSQNYRDNWTLAVTPDFTVGVWAGNFNADPMLNVSGVTGAAPIAHEIVSFLHEKNPWHAWSDEISLEKHRVCSLSGKNPTKHCPHMREEFLQAHHPDSDCKFHTDSFLNLPLVYRLWQQENLPQTIKPMVLQKNSLNAFSILSPENGATYQIDPLRPKKAQYLSLRTSQQSDKYEVYLNGHLISYQEAMKIELVPGRHELKILLEESLLDKVRWDVH